MSEQKDHGESKTGPAATVMLTSEMPPEPAPADLNINRTEAEGQGVAGPDFPTEDVAVLPDIGPFDSEVITIVLQLLPPVNKPAEAQAQAPGRVGLLSIRNAGDAPIFGPLLHGSELEELTNAAPVARLILEVKEMLSRRPTFKHKPEQPDKSTASKAHAPVRTAGTPQAQSDPPSPLSQTISRAALTPAAQSEPTAVASTNEVTATPAPEQLSMF